MKKSIYFHILVLFYIFLFVLTSFTILYELVIPHGGYYVEDPTTTTTTTSTQSTVSGEQTTITTTKSLLSYKDELPLVLEGADLIGFYQTETVNIHIYEIRLYNSQVYVADVVVEDASTILTALAHNNFGGKNYVETVSAMAESHDAIFAINADYASHYDTGYVIRNGQILRSSVSYRNCVTLYDDGHIGTFAESSIPINDVLNDGAWQLWSFGPVLINDSVSVASVNDGLDRDAVNNPRTAFGMVSPNHFMFVCVDGRTTISAGVDIEELADIMLQLNTSVAYNFDGGGSSTMYFDGEVINIPSQGSEREVSDCVYIQK